MNAKKKTVLTVIGARPQFIKASAFSAAVRNSSRLNEVVVHTGQHFDANMSDVFFSELDMDPPAYDLDIHGGSHGAMTGRMLVEIERVLLERRPDAVLVYGDTNSTLAGALAAVKLGIPIAHVEAGLRSFNMDMPEEVNRILTDRVSQWLFTPTSVATEHLLREGTPVDRIEQAGDVMFDVARLQGERLRDNGPEALHPFESGKYCLVTIHRQENTDDPQKMEVIVRALRRFSETNPVVFPLHPRTRDVLKHLGLDQLLATENIRVIDPQGYLSMVRLERNAALIATDSGGVQKEAFFHGVPCVTLRDETEWTELVDAGWNTLVPPRDSDGIYAAMSSAIGQKGRSIAPYGEADAAQKILRRLERDLFDE